VVWLDLSWPLKDEEDETLDMKPPAVDYASLKRKGSRKVDDDDGRNDNDNENDDNNESRGADAKKPPDAAGPKQLPFAMAGGDDPDDESSTSTSGSSSSGDDSSDDDDDDDRDRDEQLVHDLETDTEWQIDQLDDGTTYDR
jgi:hypothetical protein